MYWRYSRSTRDYNYYTDDKISGYIRQSPDGYDVIISGVVSTIHIETLKEAKSVVEAVANATIAMRDK